ncbi:MAG TPA: malectin domain-containing carbohydrate-binding protein [Verrucomicrobiae bacterium]|nr:malectin domain-containing carbohydrate-binding protein [Verrucomicrobiae bacterium]
MKKTTLLLLALAAFATVNAHAQKFTGLALTPPMGWNSWNKFAGNINEDLIRQTADAMATNGMRDAGYVYIVVDDCWEAKDRDKAGNIVADPNKFPGGMKALGDYLHAKGFKFGIHNCAGTKTCAGFPGGRGHEFQDALTYASWGVDFLKYDWCEHGTANSEETYKTMRDGLATAGRPIVFSLCEWGDTKPWLWAKDIGHLWRTTGDIYNCFDCVYDHGTWNSFGVLQILDKQDGLRQYAGPGHWNDPDMLEVGNGMPVNEERAHFAMWCMLAAPLMAGNDMQNMSPETRAILTNPEAIAVDQDTLGVQGFKYSAKDGVETWFKPLADGDWAMCVLNRNKAARKFSFDWANEKVTDGLAGRDAGFSTNTYALHNLWTQKSVDTTGQPLATEIPGHDVLMLRLKNGPPGSSEAAPAKSRPIIRIKAGVDAPFTDNEGNVWEADHGFVGGDTERRDENLPVANTKDPALYRTERYGMTAFSQPLANGKYTVKLHFAETYEEMNAPGLRVFSFNVQGREFKDLDLFAKAGGLQRAYVESIPVDITGGKLDITFTAGVENPEINGIEIIPQP